ncbi:hypothetical protein BVRB_7g164050 [Beta vulgaris subsp. vulgaris]|nr:hypothetical protein BVRB_7g164050 [Beta vulgaris subsp. vulgaris]
MGVSEKNDNGNNKAKELKKELLRLPMEISKEEEDDNKLVQGQMKAAN